MHRCACTGSQEPPESDADRMQNASLKWRDHLILVRQCVSSGERSAILRRHRSGELVSIARGAYLSAALWESLGPDARYRARIGAVAESLGPGTVFSHGSAAALWRLPWVGQWPTRVHTSGPSAPGGRSSRSVFRHTTGVPPASETIDDLVVTSLTTTVIDIARTTSFGTAVAVADAALRRTSHRCDRVPATHLTHSELFDQLADIPLRHGSAQARAVVEFADGLADRPGESMSRVSMLRAGLSAPQLQVSLTGRSGRRWIVDFWWPSHNLIGEFDGKQKYTDPEFLRGRTGQQTLLDEKFREDDLRAAGHRMSRWGWDVAVSPSRLRAQLLAAGLR